MSKIFVSHSSQDNAKALAVAQWLDQNGWGEYFLDITPSRGLSPGERWQEALKTAADRCEAVLFLISPAWRDSKWCLAEFLLAKQIGKTIFGVIVETTSLDSLPREMTTEWQLCDLVTGTEQHSFHVHRDQIVPPTDISLAGAGLASLKQGLQKAGLDPSVFPWPPPNDPERQPYRGLKALEAEDAAVFFGREAALIRGLDTLRRMDDRGERLLVILGASGAGKSSFLRAGLWPRLKRDDRHFLPLPVVRPERSAISGQSGVLASFEKAFHDCRAPKTRAQIRTTMEEPCGALHLIAELQALAQKALGPQADPPTVVFAIDQGEELFAKEGGAEAQRLLDLLKDLAAQPTNGETALAARHRTIVMVAIRSDSYERLQTAPTLVGVRQTPFSLPPLAQAEYKMVIEGPAARATAAGRKLIVKPDLTEQLLKDAAGADALPLLAFVLERLFIEHGADGDLRLDEYEALDGLKGSIEAAITEAFKNPGQAPVIPANEATRIEWLRRTFPSLVTLDQDTEQAKRRVATWRTLPLEVYPLLERLIDARLLLRDQRVLPDGQEAVVVEVAHEALLRQWGTLTTWLKLEGANLKLADSVRRAAADWHKAKQDKKEDPRSWLAHRGEALADAERLLTRADYDGRLSQDEREYLKACRDKERTERTEREAELNRTAEAQRQTNQAQRWTKYLLAAIAVILIVAGWWMILQTKNVERQTVLLLASEAKNANDKGLYDRALKFAVVASRGTWLVKHIPEAEAELSRAAHASAQLSRYGGHDRAVTSAAFSADGKQVVTASFDNTARLWDSATGLLLATLTGHESPVTSAAFSADGKQVVTASRDRTARLWDSATGLLLATLTGHESPVFSAAFSADGKQVVTASADRTARLWDSATGKPLATLTGHEGTVFSPAFSADGKQVVTASFDNTARLWDSATGKPLATLTGHEGTVFSPAFSADGKQVVTASADRTARLWDSATGKPLATLTGHESDVFSAAFSADGKQVVTASDDQTARLWDSATGKPLATLTGHEGTVNSAAFSADGKQVVTASFDNTARLWDSATGQPLATLTGHKGDVTSAAFSADGKQVVTASFDNTARLWDSATGKPLATLTGHEGPVTSQAFSADGTQIVTASDDQTARLWDSATGLLLATLHGHEGPMYSAAFSADGKQVVTASDDQTARLWDSATGLLLATLTGHESPVTSAAFSTDGKQVVTASDDRTARLWDSATGKPLATLTGHEGTVTSAAFSADGKQVVTASFDNTARLWDSATGQPLATLNGHESPVFSAAFSADGKQVVTASRDRTARLWDSATGKPLATLTGHESDVNSAAFSADGTQIVTASDDQTARLWDSATGKPLATLTGHEGDVNSAAFSADGTQIVTASDDQTARLWDVHWITQYHGQELIDAVCQKKLNGARTLTERDVQVSPILSGREGEDVCSPPSFLSRVTSTFGFSTQPTVATETQTP